MGYLLVLDVCKRREVHEMFHGREVSACSGSLMRYELVLRDPLFVCYSFPPVGLSEGAFWFSSSSKYDIDV